MVEHRSEFSKLLSYYLIYKYKYIYIKKIQDDVQTPASHARDEGIIVYAVGVGEAIRNELLEIASEPISRHKFSVADFDAIEEIRSNLRRTICIGNDLI